MKILFLSILKLSFMVHQPVDAQNTFEPFLLYYFQNRNVFRFPSEAIPSIGDENVTTSCPAETVQDMKHLDIISTSFPGAKYCLFKKIFTQDEPKYCKEQPKPWLESHHLKDSCSEECRALPEHQAYSVGFYFCGPSGRMRIWDKRNDSQLVAAFQEMLNLGEKNSRPFPVFYPMYDICINTSNGKTKWTKHNIMKPAMFKDNLHKLQREIGGDAEINTDSLLFEENTFANLKAKFDAQKQNEESNKMLEAFLVPKEHIALRVWRNAVNHFINVAPLWDKLEKLMIAINQRIRRIALRSHSNNEIFDIYTTVVELNEDEESTRVNSQFSTNIWYEYLFESGSRTAAFVVLHNTPISPPENKLCETEIPCDLKKWYEKTDDNDEGISEEVAQYGYCCYPSVSEVKKLFNFDTIIDGPLNLDDFL